MTTPTVISAAAAAAAPPPTAAFPFASPTRLPHLSFASPLRPHPPPLRCQVAAVQPDAGEVKSIEKVGSKVKVKSPMKVYHVPRIPEVEITPDMEGVVKQYVGIWKGKRITANYPFKVQFSVDVPDRGLVKFVAHLREDEFDFVDFQGVFGWGVISREDCTKMGRKGVDVVLYHPRMVLIVDDDVEVWGEDEANVIKIEAYDSKKQGNRNHAAAKDVRQLLPTTIMANSEAY